VLLEDLAPWCLVEEPLAMLVLEEVVDAGLLPVVELLGAELLEAE